MRQGAGQQTHDAGQDQEHGEHGADGGCGVTDDAGDSQAEKSGDRQVEGSARGECSGQQK